MLQDDYQDRREQMGLELQISALNNTIKCLEHAKFRTEVAYQQQISELKQENTILLKWLRDAGEDIALLKERLPPNGCVPENQPPVPDFEAVSLAVNADHHPLPTEVTMGAIAVGQCQIDDRSVASHVPDKVVVVQGLPDLENNFVALLTINGDNSASSSNDAIIPVWSLAFRESVELLRARLAVQPELALHYKAPGPLLHDLASGSINCGKYFVSMEAERIAKESSDTYLAYAVLLFEDFFDQEVALYCILGGCFGLPVAGDLLAVLPEQAVAVYLSHCVFVATYYFRSDDSEQRMVVDMAKWINDRLQRKRVKYGMGPTVAQYSQYSSALRRLQLTGVKCYI